MIGFLKKRRSIRKYKDVEVEKEKLDKILKAALLAPSSKGLRTWEFIVVDDKEKLINLSQCRTKGGGFFLKNAPLAIVIIADKEKNDVWIEDASIAASYIQLQAHELGLGSCWIQVRNRMHDDNIEADKYIREELKVPSKYSVECIISIGYPDEEKKAYGDSDLDYKKVHFNHF
ncbi:TPA: nitroreductase family protein [Clostridioides difficile]|nr:nitroreductase family protein [Clostridioides difficile]EQE14822.1 nitroreductase family protein [Clostridioides difficile CD8]EQF05915.1 nitroreductase family protein [Clostridioides difficile CD131]EQJ00293.1 nitroreductase family protein [Clostridioides difficile P5]OFU23566.1 NAD(P)H nitroreductase [Clostridium sp. HMSC19B12]OFU40721.1 NAD(P)H nitroreductase [Clostridium sp. HMSC19B04]